MLINWLKDRLCSWTAFTRGRKHVVKPEIDLVSTNSIHFFSISVTWNTIYKSIGILWKLINQILFRLGIMVSFKTDEIFVLARANFLAVFQSGNIIGQKGDKGLVDKWHVELYNEINMKEFCSCCMFSQCLIIQYQITSRASRCKHNNHRPWTL